MAFIRAANPIWFFVDLIGQPLNDEYYAFFLTNTLPYLPQNVYRDPQGQTVWTGDVLQFFPNGTLPDNLYFDDTLVYRIEIRHGNSQTDPLIYEINNFVPGDGNSAETTFPPFYNAINQISNSQLSLISFTSPHTITTQGTYQIAPGWELVLNGVGTTTLTQLVFSGTSDQPNDPPFAVRIDNNGWVSAFLRQRFNHNGAIFTGGAVSMTVTARAQTAPETISLIYAPSSTGIPPSYPVVVKTQLLTTGDFQVVAGAVNLPASDNADLSTVAYVDMVIQLPTVGIVDIADFQVVGQGTPLTSPEPHTGDIPSFQQQSEEREVDHLFHYYKSQLITKPKKSLLTAWNFPLNPYQFITTTVTTVSAMTSYIADQTILHQEAASQLQTGQNSVAERQNLLVKAVTAATTTRFALIQYIDPATIRPYWSYVLAAFARARIFTTHGTSVHLKCRLLYRSSLPPTLSDVEPIASWGAAGTDPVFAAGWTAIAPMNDPSYLLPNAYATDEVSGENAYPGFSFDQFQLPNADNAEMTLAIVVYTMENLDATAASEDSIAFDKISLIPSYFGADALPQTFDQCLQDCQFYYEKSYENGVLPGANTDLGLRLSVNPVGTQAGANDTLLNTYSFNLVYNTIKRAIPTPTFYSVDGTVNNVRLGIWNGTGYQPADGGANPVNVPVTNWSAAGGSTKSIFMRPNSLLVTTTINSPPAGFQGEIIYHFTADARMGL